MAWRELRQPWPRRLPFLGAFRRGFWGGGVLAAHEGLEACKNPRVEQEGVVLAREVAGWGYV